MTAPDHPDSLTALGRDARATGWRPLDPAEPDCPGDRDQQQAAEFRALARKLATPGSASLAVESALREAYEKGKAAARADGDRLRERVRELADELNRFGNDRDRDNEDDDEAQAASAAAYLRSAHLIRAVLDADRD